MTTTLRRPKAKVSKGLTEQAKFTKPLKVNRDSGIIFNVKVLGYESVNGRRYTPECIKAACESGIYENKPVNKNHPANPDDPRSIDDRIGKLFDVRYVEGDGARGNLMIDVTHPDAERIFRDAEQGTGFFGLSHNAQGEGDYKDGVFVVRRLAEVRHVDVVADPATTNSLSESRRTAMPTDTELEESKKKNKKVKEDYEDEEKDEKDEEDEEEGCSSKMKEGKAKKKKVVPEDDEEDEDDEEKNEGNPHKHADHYEHREPMKRIKALEAELARRDRQTAVRKLCEQFHVTADDELVADLCELTEDACKRHVKRLAETRGRPKAGTFGGEEFTDLTEQAAKRFDAMNSSEMAGFLQS